MKFFETDLLNYALLGLFLILTIVLIVLGNQEDTCSAENNSLFQTTKTNLFGNECENPAMFWIVCLLAILVQIARNILWIKNSQATREALKVKSDKRSFTLLLPLLLYTFTSTALYIFSILIILGGNMVILICVLIGNLSGVALSMSEQEADKERLTTAMINLKCKWEALQKEDPSKFNKDQLQEYKDLKEIKEWVQDWLSEPMQTLNPESNPLLVDQALRLRY